MCELLFFASITKSRSKWTDVIGMEDLSRLRSPNRIICVVLGNFGGPSYPNAAIGNPAHDNISGNCNVNLFYLYFLMTPTPLSNYL